MKPALFRDISRVALLLVMLASLLPAQTTASGSGARNILTAQDNTDALIQRLINKSDEHFKQGVLNLKDRKQEQARDEFDQAVDVIYESGFDVRQYARLQSYFSQLIERIYRLEAPEANTQQIAQNLPASYGLDGTEKLELRDQGYEPGNLEEIAKLELTQEEQKVTVEQTRQLTPVKIRAQEIALLGKQPRQLPNGTVPVVVQYLEDNLHDPYTMKLLKWSKVEKASRNGEPYWYVQLRYRAKNTYGAYVLTLGGYYIRNNKVVATSNN
jgi:hypothetical protein